MAKKSGWTDVLKSQVEVVASRINAFEKEADRLASDLAKRGQAQIKELEKLMAKVEGSPWADPAELAQKAKVLGGELASHFEELQGKMAHFAGVATRDQVQDLARRKGAKVEDLQRLLAPNL